MKRILKCNEMVKNNRKSDINTIIFIKTGIRKKPVFEKKVEKAVANGRQKDMREKWDPIDKEIPRERHTHTHINSLADQSVH